MRQYYEEVFNRRNLAFMREHLHEGVRRPRSPGVDDVVAGADQVVASPEYVYQVYDDTVSRWKASQRRATASSCAAACAPRTSRPDGPSDSSGSPSTGSRTVLFASTGAHTTATTFTRSNSAAGGLDRVRGAVAEEADHCALEERIRHGAEVCAAGTPARPGARERRRKGTGLPAACPCCQITSRACRRARSPRHSCSEMRQAGRPRERPCARRAASHGDRAEPSPVSRRLRSSRCRPSSVAARGHRRASPAASRLSPVAADDHYVEDGRRARHQAALRPPIE